MELFLILLFFTYNIISYWQIGALKNNIEILFNEIEKLKNEQTKINRTRTIEFFNKTFTGKNNFTGKINGFDFTKEELNPIKNDKN